MADRVALITGATNGVGRVVAERLGGEGWHVLVHGRDRSRGQEVVGAIQARDGSAQFYAADLSSLSAVRQLAEEVMKDHPGVHLLINNAGVGFGRPGAARELSKDGFELRFAVNYLAAFLLTHRLIPALLEGAPSRVVNVASLGQKELDFDDIQSARGYSGVDAYRRSKLALIMFTFDLAAELQKLGVSVNALHPATLMDTFMVQEAQWQPMSTVEEGADAIMNLAVGDLQGRTGEYFDQRRPARALRQAYDPQARERLQRIANELTAR
ncbi:MAG TPA: SDR family NAD(P)-dependent oxidoreductase [Steroidobacteraceae bacterium]|nr:SDR family NAD(P)-dependent oxidoreductase [Steroidobacteraceae bacterium]